LIVIVVVTSSIGISPRAQRCAQHEHTDGG
jgi:hypothetical protein